MMQLHTIYTEYGWNRNKGYPTLEHRRKILSIGRTPYHRETFTVQIKETELEFGKSKIPVLQRGLLNQTINQIINQ
jgi:ribonuclease HII